MCFTGGGASRPVGLESLLVLARRNDRRGINTTVGRRHVFGDQTFAVAAHALEHWIRDLCANQPVNRVLEW